MKKIATVIFLLALVFSIGCNTKPVPKPSPEPTKPDYDFSNLSKDYLLFLPGSFWVFQDDSTTALDTLTLYSSKDEIRKQNPGTTSEFSYRAMWKFFSDNGLGLFKEESFAVNTHVATTVPNSSERLYFSEDSYKIAFAPAYPFGNRISFGGEEGTFVNKELIPSLDLNGLNFKDVYHSLAEDYNDYVGDTVFYNFYYAKNYGLIKFSFDHKGYGHSYSLVSASVKQ